MEATDADNSTDLNLKSNNSTEIISSEGRSYVLHNIVVPGEKTTVISCLLNPDLIPLLPDAFSSPQTSNDNPSYRIVQTVHKGAGMFAVRDIPAGEPIVMEHPVLILPPGPFSPDAYDNLALRLPEQRTKELLSMANSRPPSECKSPVEGIVKTNALVLELDPKGKIPEEQMEIYGGVYPLINRCNHSCGPNAAVKWDLATLTSSLYALRPIHSGEEINKTYVNPVLPRQTRLTILQKSYRFTCDCPWCNMRQHAQSNHTISHYHSKIEDLESLFTPDEVARVEESDNNRARLGSWILTHPGYRKWSRDLARADDLVISSHLEALSLIEREGMQGLQNLFIEEIAMCYAMLGDLDAFREWGDKMVQLSRIEDPILAKRFEEWLVDPQRKMKRWAWRKRQREQTPGKRKMKAGHDLESVIPVDAFQFLFHISS